MYVANFGGKQEKGGLYAKHEEEVCAYYNITIKDGGFVARGGSRWVKEMRHLFPECQRSRSLPPSLLENCIVRLRLRDANENKKRRKFGGQQKYSVVAEMLELIER